MAAPVGKIGKILALIVLMAGIWGIVSSERQRATDKNSFPDGAAIARAANAAIELKHAMRDPDSFQLSSVSIIYPTKAACYEYRSRNGFGGMNVGQAVLSPKGLFKTNGMDGFRALWKSECTGKRGYEEADAVTYLLAGK